MALVFCRECGQQISDKAETCPHCGYRYRVMPVETLADKRRKAEEERRAGEREIREEYKKKLIVLRAKCTIISIISVVLFFVGLEEAAGMSRYEWRLFWEYGYDSEKAMTIIMLFAISLGMDTGSLISYKIGKRRIENEELQAIHSFQENHRSRMAGGEGWWDCPKCGKENPPYCGTCDCGAQKPSSQGAHFQYAPVVRQWWTCSRCGEENPASSRICSCGESKPN